MVEPERRFLRDIVKWTLHSALWRFSGTKNGVFGPLGHVEVGIWREWANTVPGWHRPDSCSVSDRRSRRTGAARMINHMSLEACRPTPNRHSRVPWQGDWPLPSPRPPSLARPQARATRQIAALNALLTRKWCRGQAAVGSINDNDGPTMA